MIPVCLAQSLLGPLTHVSALCNGICSSVCDHDSARKKQAFKQLTRKPNRCLLPLATVFFVKRQDHYAGFADLLVSLKVATMEGNRIDIRYQIRHSILFRFDFEQLS